MAICQSLETYAGHKRIGVDLMWFKNFKNAKDERTPFLFFSRNRASTDYQNAPTAFGSTNAVSYNFKNGVGFVTVASFLNSGFTPKLGVQYFKQKGDFMFFGWWVADLRREGSLDLFGLFRYQPTIKNQWKGFFQAELFPVFNPTTSVWNITQRLRLGGKRHSWAGGLMMDLNQTGKDSFTTTNNIGAFVRYDF
ncbi:MAG: hypothetical protein U0Y10_23130 [Spirosomataceae bacterium]